MGPISSLPQEVKELANKLNIEKLQQSTVDNKVKWKFREMEE